MAISKMQGESLAARTGDATGEATASDEISGEWTGDEASTNLDPAYILDAMKGITGKVAIEVGGPLDPVMFRADVDPEWLAVVMPKRD